MLDEIHVAEALSGTNSQPVSKGPARGPVAGSPLGTQPLACCGKRGTAGAQAIASGEGFTPPCPLRQKVKRASLVLESALWVPPTGCTQEPGGGGVISQRHPGPRQLPSHPGPLRKCWQPINFRTQKGRRAFPQIQGSALLSPPTRRPAPIFSSFASQTRGTVSR